MKLTKAYFEYLAISWNCWECGLRNRASISDTDHQFPVVNCSRCKSERKLQFDMFGHLGEQCVEYPDDPKRDNKLRDKSAKYARQYKKKLDAKRKEEERASKNNKSVGNLRSSRLLRNRKRQRKRT